MTLFRLATALAQHAFFFTALICALVLAVVVPDTPGRKAKPANWPNS